MRRMYYKFLNQSLRGSQTSHGILTRLVVLVALVATTLYLTFRSHYLALSLPQSYPWSSSLPQRSHANLPTLISSSLITCPRRALVSQEYFKERNKGKKPYEAFDNVLLVVFFSHARYDVNLDYYREVYGEFFPNVSCI
jgi:hypothetical protein